MTQKEGNVMLFVCSGRLLINVLRKEIRDGDVA